MRPSGPPAPKLPVKGRTLEDSIHLHYKSILWQAFLCTFNLLKFSTSPNLSFCSVKLEIGKSLICRFVVGLNLSTGTGIQKAILLFWYKGAEEVFSLYHLPWPSVMWEGPLGGRSTDYKQDDLHMASHSAPPPFAYVTLAVALHFRNLHIYSFNKDL